MFILNWFMALWGNTVTWHVHYLWVHFQTEHVSLEPLGLALSTLAASLDSLEILEEDESFECGGHCRRRGLGGA